MRIDFEQYQFTGPGQSSPLLNGMVGNATSYYELGQYLWQAAQAGGGTLTIDEIGFNSFLSPMQGFDVATSSGGGAGMLDMYSSGLRQPFIRVFYPSAMASADSAGSVGAAGNVAIVAAASFTDMEAATTAFTTGEPFPSSVTVLWLRGRAAVVPEISVIVNNEQQWVAVGTTVRQLLNQRGTYVMRPLAGPSAGGELDGITIARSVAGLTDPSAAESGRKAFHSTQLAPIMLSSNTGLQSYYDGSDYLDMPLLAGDSISLNPNTLNS